MSEHGQGRVQALYYGSQRRVSLSTWRGSGCLEGAGEFSHWGRCTWQGCNATEVAIKEQMKAPFWFLMTRSQCLLPEILSVLWRVWHLLCKCCWGMRDDNLWLFCFFSWSDHLSNSRDAQCRQNLFYQQYSFCSRIFFFFVSTFSEMLQRNVWLQQFLGLPPVDEDGCSGPGIRREWGAPYGHLLSHAKSLQRKQGLYWNSVLFAYPTCWLPAIRRNV